MTKLALISAPSFREGIAHGWRERVPNVTRRIASFALALLVLVVTLPLLVGLAVAIRLESPGSPVFRQVRAGLRGRPFTMYKLRGMYSDARQRWPQMYAYSYTDHEARSLLFHERHDPRVTRVGRFIRSTSLDELPNLINVLTGDMLLVGPRPEIPEMIPYYGEAAAEILSVPPGVTSLAKATGRDNLTLQETIEMELRYVRRRSLALDFRISVATIFTVLGRKGNADR